MKIIKNEKLIKRNRRIGNWTTIAALAILGGGMYFSVSDPTNSQQVLYSFVSLAVGFVLTQVGLYMGNRWGRSPRPDELLDAGLKGLPGEFSIYHYTAPTSHLLVGPAGIWAILPYRQRGIVTYVNNRWRVGSGGFLQAYMSIFGQEGIGRPDYEAEREINAVKKLLAKRLDENNIPEINAALVFTNELVEIEAKDASMPAMKLKQLKDFMRQKAKQARMTPLAMETIKSALEE